MPVYVSSSPRVNINNVFVPVAYKIQRAENIKNDIKFSAYKLRPPDQLRVCMYTHTFETVCPLFNINIRP